VAEEDIGSPILQPIVGSSLQRRGSWSALMLKERACRPFQAMALAFTAYGAAAPNSFTPSAIFSSIALFGVMRMPLIFLPFALVQVGD
jgi:hypothetical protein